MDRFILEKLFEMNFHEAVLRLPRRSLTAILSLRWKVSEDLRTAFRLVSSFYIIVV